MYRVVIRRGFSSKVPDVDKLFNNDFKTGFWVGAGIFSCIGAYNFHLLTRKLKDSHERSCR